MIKSLHLIMIFFWGYILFVRVQCRGTLGILNESKLSKHKELCFRRCDIGFQADDKGISSKKIFGRRSCYERCLREDDMNSAKNELRAFADEQKMSFLKRIRRVAGKPKPGIMYGAENCTTGSAESNSNATVVGGLGIVFHEIEDTGRYQGTVTWKPLQNVNGNWTGYKILTLYRPLDSPSNCCNIFECDVVDKNVTQYNISNSSYGIENSTQVNVLVVSSPHLNNLWDVFTYEQLPCILPKHAIHGCGEPDEEATLPNSGKKPKIVI
ncbi:uncharacterized protein LOC111346013 isoform X2 [Stylophora pistillata]|uniref:uncharacterized protein LOC111346013 isoform X2 n=1 Tax=Stylophora pistillata TaxID=50429 RepID=UPI000C044CE9|nr:uncharacterized protein LOC111346013 isoform X2 [Stylophora pistillata]